MGCMKCGRETKPDQVFCDSCLEVMEFYPVKPGTAVQLPKRRETPVRKAVKRRGPSPEEMVKILKRRIAILTFSLIAALIAAGLLAVPAFKHFFVENKPIPGQNYSTVIHTTPSTTGN